MGKQHYAGSKGDLRRALNDAALQIRELSTFVAVFIKREGGEVVIEGEEMAAVKPDSIVDVAFDKSKGKFTLKYREEEEEGEPTPTLSAYDIVGGTAPGLGFKR